MADQPEQSERTEEPSQRKLDEAARKGDVAKSQEVATLLLMVGVALTIGLFGAATARRLTGDMSGLLGKAHAMPVDGGALMRLYVETTLSFVGVVIGPLALLAAFGALGHLVQHGPVWSAEPLKPKFSKVSPLAGLKRLFSTESLVGFAKGLAKLAAVSIGIGAVLWPERDRLDTMIGLDMGALLALTQDLTLKAVLAVLAVMAVVAVADLVHQRRRWHTRQRMTRQEVKDEFKETEGNPEIKARIKSIRVQRARKRMMAAVPGATVVIANPTHFAVALKWTTGMPAPICVAKGVDAVALRIRAAAEEAAVPVVENPPLARALYRVVDLDQPIPEEHYRAVAEVIGFVMRLAQERRWRPA